MLKNKLDNNPEAFTKFNTSFASSFFYFPIIIISNASGLDGTLRHNFETDIAQTKKRSCSIFYLWPCLTAYWITGQGYTIFQLTDF